MTVRPGESKSPAAAAISRILVASVTVAVAVDNSAGRLRWTSTPLRSVNR